MGTQQSTSQQEVQSRAQMKTNLETEKEFRHPIPNEVAGIIHKYSDESSLSHCIFTPQDQECIFNCKSWMYQYIFNDSARYAVFRVYPKTSAAPRLVFVPIVQVKWIFFRPGRGQFEIVHDIDYEDIYITLKRGKKQIKKQIIDIERSGTDSILQTTCSYLSDKRSKIRKFLVLNSVHDRSRYRDFLGFAGQTKIPIPYIKDPYEKVIDSGEYLEVFYTGGDDFPQTPPHIEDAKFQANVNAWQEQQYSYDKEQDEDLNFDWAEFEKRG